MLDTQIAYSLYDAGDIYLTMDRLMEIVLKWAVLVDRREIQRFIKTFASAKENRFSSNLWSEDKEREWLVLILRERVMMLKISVCPNDTAPMLDTDHKESTSAIARMLAKQGLPMGLDTLTASLTKWICLVFVQSPEELRAAALEMHFPVENWDIKRCSDMLLYIIAESLEARFNRNPLDLKYWKEAAKMP